MVIAELFNNCRKALNTLKYEITRETAVNKKEELQKAWDDIYKRCVEEGQKYFGKDKLKYIVDELERFREIIGTGISEEVRGIMDMIKRRHPYKL